MAFASLCYHKQYLIDNIHQEKTLHASSFFKDIPQEILKCATVRYSWNASTCTPKLTGIPPHVSIMAEFRELKLKFDELRQDIKGDLQAQLDARGVVGNRFHAKKILEALSETQRKVDMIVNGNRFPINDVLEQGENVLIADEESMSLQCNPDNNPEIESERDKRKKSHSKSSLKRRKLTMGFHNGRLQVLPVHWKFPRMTGKQLIENWFIGNTEEKIPPYALLKFNHVKHIKNAVSNLRMMKSFMLIVQRYATDEDIWEGDPNKWNVGYTKVL